MLKVTIPIRHRVYTSLSLSLSLSFFCLFLYVIERYDGIYRYVFMVVVCVLCWLWLTTYMLDFLVHFGPERLRMYAYTFMLSLLFEIFICQPLTLLGRYPVHYHPLKLSDRVHVII